MNDKDNDELIGLFSDFFERFELVFGAQDWDMTKSVICDGTYIKPDGTFLKPGVDDESNNWANRGSLLNRYRRLKRKMVELGLSSKDFETLD